MDGLTIVQAPQQTESLLSDNLVLLESASRSKEEVIQEMVDAFYVSNRTDDRLLLEEALWAREAVYSTGLGYGFATPHCKTDAVTADSICILRLREPINWDSVDGERVRMVVLLALRNSEAAGTHMQVFSTLARKLMNDDFRQHSSQRRDCGPGNRLPRGATTNIPPPIARPPGGSPDLVLATGSMLWTGLDQVTSTPPIVLDTVIGGAIRVVFVDPWNHFTRRLSTRRGGSMNAITRQQQLTAGSPVIRTT